MGDITSMQSFTGVHDSAKGFIAASKRMEDRLEELMSRVNQMNWTSEGRDAYDQIQRKFNSAYDDLKRILYEIGSNVDGIATNQEDLEKYLSRKVWAPRR
jgi:uncharacterized protein YukE